MRFAGLTWVQSMCSTVARPSSTILSKWILISLVQQSSSFSCTCLTVLQRAAELDERRNSVRASVEAEHNRLLDVVAAQQAALADKEKQLEVCVAHA